LPHREIFALRPLVEEAACAALECQTKPSACFDNCIDPALMAEADREQLFRIVLNIARNACEATGGVGTITVCAARKGGAVEIEIADNGPGIPEQVKAKLFQPFVSAARPGGSGLGLAIARDLARAHGGDLVLVSTGAEGTVFRIILPDQSPIATPSRRGSAAPA
jgi:signal transduction histidine kinase